MVDIRAPLYLLDPESHLRENATATLQSNGGGATFSLAVEAWPQPPRGLRVHQMTNGNHAWHAEPADSAAQLRLGLGGAGGALFVLWLVARVARQHAYAAARAERAAAARRKPLEGAGCPWDVEAAMAAAMAAAAAAAAVAPSSDAVESDDDALTAVRAMQARERAGDALASARAAEKAAALEAWHAASAAPGGAWGDAASGSGGAGASSGSSCGGRNGDSDAEAGRGGAGCGGASGNTAAAAPPSGAAALCTVCLSRPRDTVILPCRHVALCMTCARRLAPPPGEGSAGAVPGAGVCPICRGRLENYLQLFMA
jgi:hypothetical protein